MRSSIAQCLDEELHNVMSQAKKIAIMMEWKEDWEIYCKLINKVTSAKRKNKRLHFQVKIQENKNQGRKV